MTWFLIVLFVVLVVLFLIFTIALKVRFAFNSDNANINLVFWWLYPFLKVVITNQETKLLLTVYIFRKSLLTKTLKSGTEKPGSGLELIKRLHPTDVNINAEYGFADPFITGIACSIVNAVSKFIDIDTLRLSPDFATSRDYIYLDGSARLSMGSTLINLARS